MRRFVCVLGLLVFPVLAHAAAPAMRSPDRAASDLLRVYAGSDDIEMGRRVENAGLSQADAAYLLALAKQTLADEPHGVWANQTYFSGGEARKQREYLARDIGEFGSGDGLIELVLWYIDNDPNFDDVTKVAPALARIPAVAEAEMPGQRQLILGRFIDHPNDAVAMTAIGIAGAHHMVELAGPIKALTGSYRENVRAAAVAQAEALGFTPAEYVPEKGITPWLEKQLVAARGRVSAGFSHKDAPWRHFTHTDPQMTVNNAPYVTDFGGWLLGETDTTYHVVDWAGLERTLAKAQTKAVPATLEEDAAAWIAKNTPSPSEGGRGGRGGGLGVSSAKLPALMMGAWLYDLGKAADAARVLFPVLNEVRDQRQAVAQMRDGLALEYRAAMLTAFANRRDYAEAARIARHLGSPAFEGWSLQSEARALAVQLARRSDDFVKLKLPEADEWTKLKVTLARGQQVEYLMARLRLVTASNPGRGMPGFEGQQDRDPPAQIHWGRGQPPPVSVVNPYEELRSMKLSLAEARPLLGLLTDDDYVPMSSPGFPLFDPNLAPLLQVKAAAAALLNDAAGQTIADLRAAEAMDAAGKKQWLAKITAWVDAHAGMPRAEALLESLRTAKAPGDLYMAAQELALLGDKRATPILIDRYRDFARDQDYSSLAMLLYHLDPQNSVAAARGWVGVSDYHLRFWAAMILVHSGNGNAGEGWPELLAVLAEHNNNQYVPHAFDELLASPRQDAQAFAISVLQNKELMQSDAWPYVHRLLLAGRKEALDYALRQLDDTAPTYDLEGTYQSEPVTRTLVRGDAAAATIAGWRTDKYAYPQLAPDNLRQEERARLKVWLTDQFSRISGGKPIDLAPARERLRSAQWNFPPN